MAYLSERDLGATLRSAARIEPERLPRLRLVAVEWAEALRTNLEREFSASVQVDYAGANLPGHDGQAAGGPAMAIVAPSPGWPQPAFASVDASFCDLVAEALFGGDGSAPSPAPRAPTGLDRRFARSALERVLQAGNTALAPVVDCAFSTGELVSAGVGERLAELSADGRSPYTRLAFWLTLGRLRSLVEIGLPEAVLTLHRRKLDHLPEPPAPPADATWTREIEEGLLDARMEVRALLDERQTTLGEIAGFALGQTIVLDTRIDGLVTLECEDQRLFRGRIGRSREAYLIRIEEKIDPTEEFIDDILAD